MPLVMRSRASASRLEFPCRSSPVRGRRRRFGTEIIAKSKAHTKRGMQVHRNASRPNHNCSNKKTAKTPNNASHPYVPLPVFLDLRTGRGGSLRFGLMKNVEDCRTRYGAVETY